MASVVFDKRSGTRKIQFTAPDGRRKSIRLGKVTAADALEFKRRVEALLRSRLTGYEWKPELSAWVADRPDVMHARLESVDLVPPRRRDSTTLGNLLERFVAASNVKKTTRDAYRQTTNSLRTFFGNDAPISTITPEQAAAWRREIADSKLSMATCAKRVFVARSIFSRAIKWKLLRENPFTDVKAGSQANPDRQRYVSRENVAAVLRNCPDTEWRAIIGLSRFAALRCPSEIMLLRWQDVNWERSRLCVRSPKTAGHDGHAERMVPIDPELRPILLQLFDEAADGAEHVIERHRVKSCNLRTTFRKIIKRAGLVPWPRVFHNLRASQATDWCERFPAHAVAAWCGHSPMIAAKHYLTTRDEHFAMASRDDVDAEKSGAKSGALSGTKAVQSRAATNCTDSHESLEVLSGCEVVHDDAEQRNAMQDVLLGDQGIEPRTRWLRASCSAN